MDTTKTKAVSKTAIISASMITGSILLATTIHQIHQGIIESAIVYFWYFAALGNLAVVFWQGGVIDKLNSTLTDTREDFDNALVDLKECEQILKEIDEVDDMMLEELDEVNNIKQE